MRHIVIIFAAVALLGNFSVAETVSIGKYDAKIVPEQVATLNFQNKGVISDLLVDVSHRIEKDSVLAVMDKEKTEQEREDMELQIRRERLTKKDEIRKLEMQREKLNFYFSLNEKERTYARDIKPEESAAASEETLADINERIELTKLELNTMERRKRLDFDAKHEQLIMRMPFTGRVQYHFPMPEHPEIPFEYAHNAAVPFATVCDDSAFYITLSISDTDISLMPPDSFSAAVRLPGGKQLPGTYAYRRVERNGSRGDMLVFFFKIPEQYHSIAFRMLGSNTTATLYYSTDDSCKRVSKAELLTHPAAPNCEDWHQLAQIAYPDYVVLLVTEHDVILRPKSAMLDSAS